MKEKTKKILKIIFQGFDNFVEEIEEDLKHWDDGTRVLDDNELGVLRFESRKDFFTILTPSRIEVLGMIKRERPDSIYKLAVLLKRNFSSILQDCRKLEGGGFIKIEEKKNGNRDKSRPMLTFDYDFIVIPGMFSVYLGDANVEDFSKTA